MNRAALGLRWGLVFAAPFLATSLLGIVETFLESNPFLLRYRLVQLSFFLSLSATIPLSGRWWGHHVSRPRVTVLFGTAMAHGTIWALTALLILVILGSLVVTYSIPVWPDTLYVFLKMSLGYSVWAMLLQLTIRWRISRAYKKRLAQRRAAAVAASS